MIMQTVKATVDELVSFEIDFLNDVDGVTEWWDQTISIAEADRIIETLETNPEELQNIPTPTGTNTSAYLENAAQSFASGPGGSSSYYNSRKQSSCFYVVALVSL